MKSIVLICQVNGGILTERPFSFTCLWLMIFLAQQLTLYQTSVDLKLKGCTTCISPLLNVSNYITICRRYSFASSGSETKSIKYKNRITPFGMLKCNQRVIFFIFFQ